jgi:hypothetical protein
MYENQTLWLDFGGQRIKVYVLEKVSLNENDTHTYRVNILSGRLINEERNIQIHESDILIRRP